MASKMTPDENHLSVIGAGTMGTGIALKYASSGFKVSLIDRSEDCLARARTIIDRSLDQGVARNIFSAEEKEAIKARLDLSTELKKAQQASLVIEAIFEDKAEKRALFSLLEQNCHEETILASNTSGLLISDLQEGLIKPDRVLGLHYFFPPQKNRLVELIAGAHTSARYLARARAAQDKIGKVSINSKDSPGFIVNRFFVPWLNEAMRIVYEGQASMNSVDYACRTFFHISMGPFELMNATGVPITYHACQSLAVYLGEFYEPCPLILKPLEHKQNWIIEDQLNESDAEEVIKRMLSVVSTICKRLVFEEEVTTTTDTDIGARIGLLWKKGPFELMDSSPCILP